MSMYESYATANLYPEAAKSALGGATSASTAASGFNPLMMGLQAGGSILGGLFNWLGSGFQRKTMKQGVNNLKGMLGKDVFDVQKYISGANRAMIPQVNQYGNQVNQRFGLDQGRGQEAFLEKFMQMQDTNRFQGDYQNSILKNQRDLAINQFLASMK